MIDPDVVILQKTRAKLARMVESGKATQAEASSFLSTYAEQLTRMPPDLKKQKMLTIDSEDLL